MPIRSPLAMSRSLDNDYGPTAGPNAASGHLLALYDGDPMLDADDGGGVEVDQVGGYARTAVTRAMWSPAVDGMKSLAEPVVLPDVTAEWPTSATHYALLDADDPTIIWDCAPLAEPLEVTGAGPGPRIMLTVFYDDAVTDTDTED